MKELLGDTNKFEGLEISLDKHLNFVINSQDKIKNILLLDSALGFYMVKLRYTSLSLAIVHLLDQHLSLLTHYRVS